MSEPEALPYLVDLWAEDELSVRCLARVAELSIALMAFDAAAVSYPQSLVTVRGPGVYEAHQPRAPEGSRHSPTGPGPRNEAYDVFLP
jgi:hypothetical protein